MGSESRVERTLGVLALVAMLAGSYVGLAVVPADAAQGNVQRLMYVHVPAAWLAFLAFFIVFVMSVLYLIQRDERWDRVAASSAEIARPSPVPPSFADDGEKRARWSAIVGVIGFANVPIVYMSVTWWRTLHQPPSSPRSVSPDILWTLMLNLAAFTIVYVYLMVRRIRFAKLEGELEKRMAYNA